MLILPASLYVCQWVISSSAARRARTLQSIVKQPSFCLPVSPPAGDAGGLPLRRRYALSKAVLIRSVLQFSIAIIARCGGVVNPLEAVHLFLLYCYLAQALKEPAREGRLGS